MLTALLCSLLAPARRVAANSPLFDPARLGYDVGAPRTVGPPDAKRTIVLCVCDAPGDRFYSHLMFTRLPSVWSGAAVLVANKTYCALEPVRDDRLLVDIECRPNADSSAKYSATSAVMVRRAGEVMGTAGYRCSATQELAIYRGLDAPISRCKATVHSVQIAHMLFGPYLSELGATRLAALLERKTQARLDALLARAQQLVAYSFGKFKCCGYHGEFVFRHAIADALHEYALTRGRRTDAIGHFALHGAPRRCGGSFVNAAKCFESYRFAVVMENSRIAGYVTEKLLNAALAGAVPIYFGAPDIYRYVNWRAIIRCDVTDAEQRQLRNLSSAFTNDDPAAAVRLARRTVRAAVDACVAQVAAVDADDAAYRAMLAEPLFGEHSRRFLDGTYTSCQLARALHAIRPAFAEPLRVAPLCAD